MDRRDPRLEPITRRGALGALAAAVGGLVAGCDADARMDGALHMALSLSLSKPSAEPEPDLRLPRRRSSAPTGSAFIEKTRSMSRGDRESAVLEEVLGGNVPTFVRTMVEVPLVSRQAGRTHVGKVKVTPDYLCIGSDADFIRMPMNARTAQRVAVATGCVLPTPKLVDQIYLHAKVQLTSSALAWGAEMMSSAYFLQHDRDIEARRRQRGGRLGELTAGHKKDIVITRRLEYQPGQLAIYGWFRDDKTPIQFLSTVHEDTYVDYAQAARLVAQEMTLDGEVRKVGDVLQSTDLWAIVSAEGPVHARYAI